MKILITVIFLILSVFKANAQINPYTLETSRPILYSRFGLSGGNYFGLNSSISLVNKHNIIYEFGASIQIKNPKERPKDFESGLIGVFSLGLAGRNFHQHIFINVGKGISLNNNEKGQVIIKGGMAYSRVEEQYDFEKSPSIFGSNYVYKHRNFETISFLITPSYEVCKYRFIGYSVELPLMYNKSAFTIGIQVSFSIRLW